MRQASAWRRVRRSRSNMAYDPASTNAELQARLAVLRIILEGHQDDQRLNVESTTIDDVQVQIARYSALIAAIEDVIERNSVLIEAGWPDLLPLEVESAVIADLDAQLQSLTAARATYVLKTAARLSLEGDRPVPKP